MNEPECVALLLGSLLVIFFREVLNTLGNINWVTLTTSLKHRPPNPKACLGLGDGDAMIVQVVLIFKTATSNCPTAVVGGVYPSEIG